jgi:hypothetical protein
MRKTTIIMTLSVALLGLSSAQATMLEQMDTQRLTEKATGIHVGEVVDRQTARDPQSGMIYTFVTMRVNQTLKGSPTETVTLRVPGGQYQDYGMVVHGVASFRQGERALVFVRSDSEKFQSVVGMSQGKFRIVRSLLNGEEQALFQAPKNVEFFSRTPQGQIRHVVATQIDRKVPLNSLMQEIREAIAKEGGVSH